MKKIISVLLALIMIFSVTTVAFAAEGDADDTTPTTSDGTTSEGDEDEAEAEEKEDSLLGEYDWILDLPFATVKPALKIAKIALKFYKVYLKLNGIFGFLFESDPFKDMISDFIDGLVGEEQPEEPAPEVTTTASSAA